MGTTKVGEARYKAMKYTQGAVKREIRSAKVRKQYGYSVNIVTVTHTALYNHLRQNCIKLRLQVFRSIKPIMTYMPAQFENDRLVRVLYV